MNGQPDTLAIGVLALQGAFREHHQHIERLNPLQAARHTCISVPCLQPLYVRNVHDLEQCQALIIPGGESTAISLGAQRAGLLEPLREWVRRGKPTWGTCAGMIMLAREATGIKKGGQELLGGMDVRVGRNGFGSQVNSFEHSLNMPCLTEISRGASNDFAPFPGLFIRAPVIETLLLPKDLEDVASSEPSSVARGRGEAHESLTVQPQERHVEAPDSSLSVRPSAVGRALTDEKAVTSMSTLSVAPPLERPGEPKVKRPPLEILGTLPTLPRGAQGSVGGGTGEAEEGLVGKRPEHDSMIIALKQGNLMCTSFHPELTVDGRMHEYFIRKCALGH